MKLTELCQRYLIPISTGSMTKWASCALLTGLVLFAVSAPHSIAAAQISLVLCALAWAVRDIGAKKFHFARTSLDWPIIGFALLTTISALLSIEPGISLPKLRALLLFLIIYLCATNLRPAAVRLLIMVMLVSALTGVGFSLLEKLIGRGMIVTAIHADSPLAQSNLKPGDVIWMVTRRRVRSIEAATQIIQSRKSGEQVEIEAIHNGDPLPVEITTTDELKAKPNPLGIEVGGASRRFRVSGFTRHFITYAEQMQLFALLCFGALLAFLHRASGFSLNRRVIVSLSLVALFALTLLLTVSRAAIASFLLSLFLVAALSAGKRI
ncbi:MAG TPA: PDZ domain-containing protein, partial [Blastocatellia bacterium]|nr:PDZ domain-containing protein [Blastocatellia bacterium]